MTLSARALKALVLLALLAIVGLWVEELALLWRLLAVALLLALGLEAWWVHRSVWSLERRLPEFAELGRDFPISYRFVGPRTQLRFAEPVPSGAAGGFAVESCRRRRPSSSVRSRQWRWVRSSGIRSGPLYWARLEFCGGRDGLMRLRRCAWNPPIGARPHAHCRLMPARSGR